MPRNWTSAATPFATTARPTGLMVLLKNRYLPVIVKAAAFSAVLRFSSLAQAASVDSVAMPVAGSGGTSIARKSCGPPGIDRMLCA